jgi:hypothetical protein
MLALHECGESWWYAKRSYRVDHPIAYTEQNPELRLADARGLFHYGLEYWLKRARRRTYDAEHIRSRELFLPRIVQFAGEPSEFRFRVVSRRTATASKFRRIRPL